MMFSFSCALSWSTDAGPISREPFKGKVINVGHTPGLYLRNQVVNVDPDTAWSFCVLDHNWWSLPHKAGCKA